MPHYYFDTVDGGFTQDTDGLQLPDLAAARTKALAILADLGRVAIKHGEGHPLAVMVRNEARAEIFEASVIVVEKRLERVSGNPTG